MADWEIRITGIEAVSERVMALLARYRQAGVVALNEVAEEVLTDAKSRTPVDTGVLRDSGHVEHASLADLSADIVFGTEYAIPVHEHLSAASPPSWVAAELTGHPVQFHPEGTGPKFLERAYTAEAPKFEEDIAGKMIAIAGGG